LLRYGGLQAPSDFDAHRAAIAATRCAAWTGTLENIQHHDAAGAVAVNDTENHLINTWMGKLMWQLGDPNTVKERDEVGRALGVLNARNGVFCKSLTEASLKSTTPALHAFAHHFAGCFSSELCGLWPELRGAGIRGDCKTAMLRHLTDGFVTSLPRACAHDTATSVPCREVYGEVLLRDFDCFTEALQPNGMCSATCTRRWEKLQGQYPGCAKSLGKVIAAQQRAGLDMLRALQPRIHIPTTPPAPADGGICRAQRPRLHPISGQELQV
jgi:hypothetical protein